MIQIKLYQNCNSSCELLKRNKLEPRKVLLSGEPLCESKLLLAQSSWSQTINVQQPYKRKDKQEKKVHHHIVKPVDAWFFSYQKEQNYTQCQFPFLHRQFLNRSCSVYLLITFQHLSLTSVLTLFMTITFSALTTTVH